MADALSSSVPRTQDRMTHDVWLPTEIVELRARARKAVENRLAPHASEIGRREETADIPEGAGSVNPPFFGVFPGFWAASIAGGVKVDR